MKTYKLKLRLRSALQTPLAPDTLFGHLCWSIKYTDGEPALQAFLDAYRQGKPPLVLSGAFPEGFWPAPLLPNPSAQQEKVLLNTILGLSRTRLCERLPFCPVNESLASEKLTVFEAFDVLKWLRKLRFIPEAMLADAVEKMDRFDLLKQFLTTGCGKAAIPRETVSPHNSINRLSGRSDELYFAREYAVGPVENPVYQLLVMSDDWSADEIARRFTAALAGGYGKSKSRGAGHVEVDGVESYSLPSAAAPNAAFLLGPCCPSDADPTDGFWQVATKAGKLGGDWAVSQNPFKRPLTSLKAGAVLLTQTPTPAYGRMVENIHPALDSVVQYALSPALAVRYDPKEAL